jgi:hypothetical protein
MHNIPPTFLCTLPNSNLGVRPLPPEISTHRPAHGRPPPPRNPLDPSLTLPRRAYPAPSSLPSQNHDFCGRSLSLRVSPVPVRLQEARRHTLRSAPFTLRMHRVQPPPERPHYIQPHRHSVSLYTRRARLTGHIAHSPHHASLHTITRRGNDDHHAADLRTRISADRDHHR